jgi:hypothetical protein
MPTPLKRRATMALFASEIIAWVAFSARQANRSAAPALVLLAGMAAGWFLVCLAPRWTGHASTTVFSPGKLALALTPSWLLFLDFLPARVLLRDISSHLFILSVAGSLYLMAVIGWQSLRNKPTPAWFPGHLPETSPRPQRRTVCLVFFSAFAVYTLLLFGGLVPAMPFSGDEPHYLLMARSIVRDGDLDMYEDYRQKRYLEFYPGELEAHAYPGNKGTTRLYSKHMPALPLLLAPAYWCGERLEAAFPTLKARADPGKNLKILLAREMMALLAALLAAVFFILVWEFSGSPPVALYSWFFFAFNLPVVAYAQLLYPEIPAALILLLILFRVVTGRIGSRSSPAWTGLGIAVLPWFGIKYIVLAAAALLVVLAGTWKTSLMRKADTIRLFTPLLISGAFFTAYLLNAYGTISPFAVYHGDLQTHVTPIIHGIRFRPVTFFSTGLAYFLDQRIGLFVYSPLTMLSVPGLILWFRKSKKKGAALLLVAAVAWAFFALINFRQGYHPPGRQLLPVLPILALFAAGAFAWSESRGAVIIFRVLAVLGLFVAQLGLRQPRLLFHAGLSSETWNVDTHANLLSLFSNAGFDFTRWLPNLIYLPEFSWVVLGLWLAVLAAIGLAVLRKKTAADRERPVGKLAGHLSVVVAMSLFLVMYRTVDIRLDARRSLAIRGATAFFQDDNIFGGEEGGFWTKGDGRTAVVLRAPGRLDRLHMELSSPVPLDVSLQIDSRRIRPHSLVPGRFKAVLDISPGLGRRWKNGQLYRIVLQVTGGFVPAAEAPGSTDRRYLGLFLRLAAE